LLIPALIWSWKYWFYKKSFSVEKDFPDNGTFAKFVFSQNDVLRSCHPSHSLFILGNFPKKNLINHKNALTPLGDKSPWKDFLDYDGWILLTGCGESALTFSHMAEEKIHPNERCFCAKKIAISYNSKKELNMIRLHRPYQRNGPNRNDLSVLLKKNRDYFDTEVLKVPARFYRAEAVYHIMMKICKTNPGKSKSLLWWLYNATKHALKTK